MKIIGDGGHAKVVRDVWLSMPPSERPAADAVFVAVGNNSDRKKEAHLAGSQDFALLISPKASVSRHSQIGNGTIVCEGAVIQAGVKIGRHVIVNAGAVITHDCVIDSFAHIAPGAHLCGGVHVGEGALVGVGVGIAPGAKIPAWSLVKARRLEIEQQQKG